MTAAAAALLAGCPAPGLTENPLHVPEQVPPVVSFCYAPLVTDRDAEILPLAVEACDAAGVADAAPREWRRHLLFNECPLFKKARVAYVCDPAPAPAPVLEPEPVN